MIRIVSALILLCSVSFSFAQSPDNSSKIIEVYGASWFEQMSTDNPDVIALLNNYIAYGFEVIEVTPDKLENIKTLESIPLRSKSGGSVYAAEFIEDFNSDNFNLLIYDFFPRNETQYYHLDGTNFVIRIASQEEISKTANEQ